MIKKIFEISGDVFLSFLLLGIILTAAMSVISLSPGRAENYGYQNPKVLGTQTSSVSTLTYSDISEGNPFFKVESSGEDIFRLNVKVGPMRANKYSKKIVGVENNTGLDKKFQVLIDVPENNSVVANYGVKIEDKEFILVNGRTGQVDVIKGDIKPGENTEIELVIDPLEVINYPLELKVFVQEVN